MVYIADLVELKGVFNSMLATSEDFIFQKGRISAYHKYGISMVTFIDSNIRVSSGTRVHDMSALEDILKSKTLTAAKIDPDKSRISITKPYRFTPPIPRILDDDALEGVKRDLKIIRALKSKPKKWEDAHGTKHVVSYFTIENSILADVLARLGESESLLISTGNSLTLENVKTTAKAEIPIKTKCKSSISLAKEGQTLLLSVLNGDDSKVALVDERLMMITNDVIALIAGRIPVEQGG